MPGWSFAIGAGHMADNENWVTVASRPKLGDGDVLGVSVGEEQIALYNLGGEIYATSNVCTHAFALLSDGWLDGEVIECPLHAARFDVRTGKALCAPAETDIKVFEVKVENADLMLKVPA